MLGDSVKKLIIIEFILFLVRDCSDWTFLRLVTWHTMFWSISNWINQSYHMLKIYVLHDSLKLLNLDGFQQHSTESSYITLSDLFKITTSISESNQIWFNTSVVNICPRVHDRCPINSRFGNWWHSLKIASKVSTHHYCRKRSDSQQCS